MFRFHRATFVSACLLAAFLLLALVACNAPLVSAARAHRSHGAHVVVDAAVDDGDTAPTGEGDQDGSSEMLNIAHEFDAQSAATDANSDQGEYGSILLESSSASEAADAAASSHAHSVGSRADAYTVSDTTSAEDAAVIHRAHRIGLALTGTETADEIRRKELAIAANIANGKQVCSLFLSRYLLCIFISYSFLIHSGFFLYAFVVFLFRSTR